MHPDLVGQNVYNDAVLKITSLYSSFSYVPQHSQWTILASFFLVRHDDAHSGSGGEIKVISLATGTKCLPVQRLSSSRGEVVHDSHAEVLARRCALRWFLEEISRVHSQEGPCGTSSWIIRRSNGKYALQEGVKLNLYISTVPCGDASMQLLASVQDEDMAALKNSSVFPDLCATAASRGRDNYARLGVLRTKPGRADSPPTSCMSCSDKIARWNVLGIQGALGSWFLEPLYIDTVIIGEVPLDAQPSVKGDCERGLWKRLGNIQGLPEGFSVNEPEIHFTSIPFAHSRSVLGSSTSCNESLCWTSDSNNFEVIINGFKRGVSPKHRHREKSRPRVSKMAILQLYKEVLQTLDQWHTSLDHVSYLDLKLLSKEYQRAKTKLMGKGGPFEGWIFSGTEWQRFNINEEALP
ncbi:hypothetical protein M413DRAFT_23732 [Hebeloma cylindrosporum]|uniref:A to I editase domain-containing protein n=1 Tax=Hebeloma cylindrosporum TaxID=76867 RepID=A0A0C2YY63_HEBCY|nr:hypothetical protein M413DRAFT_23732 [Hebeloma cylindrosporum h7]